ncbi:hypothetical protein MKW94_026562 [Papaver nudicaule]|uniref:ABC transporter domain-containing protein n=1 Tax=Papaver nudicaule TaxID=74823 RepID=A0AA41VM96_PAPNU|nr:hypothetical protein [Papaver nudicaule]
MVELSQGIPLLIQQFNALLKKNILLSWRNRKSFVGQLLSPVVFILLLVGVDKVLNSGVGSSQTIDVYYPEPLIIDPPIPPCENKFYIQLPCYDFAWSGNQSPKIQSIVEKIMLNNPGRPIPSNKVKSFNTTDDVDEWLYNEPMHCAAALHFVDKSAKVISYGIQTNESSTRIRGVDEDPLFKFQLPLQIAAEREITRFLTQDPDLKWNVNMKEFAHPATQYVSAMQTAGSIFLLAITIFPFISQMGSLVAEKELKLRQVMSIMGLYESAYWLSWLVWDTVIICISSLITVGLGVMARFDFFVHNSFVVVFLGFFLFQFSMVGFAFAISTLLSKSASANTIGFLVFVVSFMTGFIVTGDMSDGFPTKYRILWNLFPPNIFSRITEKLLRATETHDDKGISWSNRNDRPKNYDSKTWFTMDDAYKLLLENFILWFLLALYLDNVIPNSSGVRKSVYFFLNPNYWTGSSGGNTEGSSCTSEVPLLDEKTPDVDDDEDVVEEKRMVKEYMKDNYEMNNNSKIVVQLRGLAKAYPGTIKFKRGGCFCKLTKTSTYHAVKGVWMNFEKDQLFCLLGPNGAGKTTTMNCLIGNLPVTGGDALIYGNSVRISVGMTNIRRLLGVCPQFDILWAELSCQEHLHLFGLIKGLPPSSLDSIVKESLAKVNLADAARIRAASCSGGMQRRLSVACAFMGDPKLVILDEPTTGMDPVTRRHVWDVIEDAKKGRVIILTTHSMEEADILGDRIAIVAKGKLRCIGTSIRLKSRFGTGLIATVSFAESTSSQIPVNGGASHHEAVKQFFKHHLDVVPKEEKKLFLTYNFFDELEDKKYEFGIADIQLGLTTLEEVFLNIAKKAELENALTEGNLVTLTLTSGHVLQIPNGANYVGVPKTESEENPRGLLVEVLWEKDESGFLTISGHSKEYRVPPSAKIVASTAKSSDNPQLGNPEVGIIYDLTDAEASRLK